MIVTYFSHKMTEETISVLLSDNAYEAMRVLVEAVRVSFEFLKCLERRVSAYKTLRLK